VDSGGEEGKIGIGSKTKKIKVIIMAVNGKPKKIDHTSWSKVELVKEIKKLEKRKKYGIIWDEETTKEIFEEEVQKKLPVLQEFTKKEITTNVNQPTNILIEGDNYHALSVLNYTHHNKVDLIYIDPPYNTGNEFTFNDYKVEKEDSYKHSKWLSFMNKRLKLAKKLLSEKGVIFISIDDNEQAQLKILCDEIFGKDNFVAQIVVVSNRKGRHYLEIAVMHEYVLCYSKKLDILLNKLPKNIQDKKYEDKKGKYELWELRNRNPKFNRKNRPNLFYPVYVNESIHDEFMNCAVSLTKTDDYSIEVFPRNKEGLDGCWRWSKRKFLENITSNNPTSSELVARKRRDQGWNINQKSRSDSSHSKSVWDEKEVTTETGTIELRNLFSDSVFDHPKPVELIKKIIMLATKKNSIVLDFFAGSGTTGHAVLELNKEDDGNRKFILCTNNENNICTDVCYPRLDKVINGYKNLKKEKIEGLEGNLKYFKTSFVDSEPTDQNKKIMVEQSTEMLCLKEDCFDLIKTGNQFKIFKSPNDHYLGIVYYYDGIEPYKKEILKLNKKISTYVFSLTDTVDDDEFTEVDQLVNLKPIPSAILNVYRRIFAYVQTKKLPRKART